MGKSRTRINGMLLLIASGCSDPQDPSVGTTVQNLSICASDPTVCTGRPVEGHADKLSVEPGQSINFYVHAPNTNPVTATIVRFGATNSAGEIVETVVTYNGCTSSSVSAPARDIDSFSVINGTGWTNPNFSITVPTRAANESYTSWNWRSGYFALKLQHTDTISGSATNRVSYIPFVVLPDAEARQHNYPILVASTNTWTAYNFWPYLPDGMESDALSFYDSTQTLIGSTASFRRPNPNAQPSLADRDRTADNRFGRFFEPFARPDHLLVANVRLAQWMEAQGITYTVITDSELSRFQTSEPEYVIAPTISPTIVLSGHSEYWTQSMDARVRSYVQNGGNVINLSGNTHYWIVDQVSNSLHYDPGGAANQPWRTTSSSELLGVMGTGNKPYGTGTTIEGCGAYTLNSFAGGFRHALLNGLSLNASVGPDGLTLPARTSAWWEPPTSSSTRSFCNNNGSGAVGWENDAAPAYPGFFRLYSRLGSHTGFLGAPPHTQNAADLVYLRYPNGGQVFSVGSILYTQALLKDQVYTSSNHAISQLTRRVFDRFAARSTSDLDGNARTDILAWDSSIWRLRRYEADGNGNIVNYTGAVVAGTYPWYNKVLAVGDLDSDGKSDLLGIDSNGNLYLHSNAGSATPPSRIQLAWFGSTFNWNQYNILIAPGDFNGDGAPDLIGRIGDVLYLVRGDGSGSFRDTGIPFNWGWTSWMNLFAVGDITGDGAPDVIGYRPRGSRWDIVRVRGNGTGGFMEIDSTDVLTTDTTSLDTAQAQARIYFGVGAFNHNTATDRVPHVIYRQGGTLHRCDASSATDIDLVPSVSGHCPAINYGWGSFPDLISVW